MRNAWLYLIAHNYLLPSLSDANEQSSSITASTSVASAIATCPSTTINYITHNLPQQCLATTRRWTSTSSSALEPEKHNATSTISLTSSALPLPSSSSDVSIPSVKTSTITEESTSLSSALTSISKDISGIVATPTTDVLSTTPLSTVQSTPVAETPVEEESPLDSVNFLSFEEWRRQNLENAGQNAEGLGQNRRSIAATGQDRERLALSNGLDTLGDDSELEIDFSGFGVASTAHSVPPSATESQAQSAQETGASSALRPRSKDAGKTCKERFNYASFDCAANVIKTNPKCKSSSSILVENKDSYMLNECNMDNKFIIVELCEDILVDTIVLSNFEFFSSMFRTFRISVSDRYPVKAEKWKELGTFEARNSREIQAFLVENPLIWARYVRVEFLTHYGSEYYCPVSLLRVHGTTMMEEYRREERAEGDGDDDEDDVVDAVDPISTVAAPSTAAPVVNEKHPSDVAQKSGLEDHILPISSLVTEASLASTSITPVSSAELDQQYYSSTPSTSISSEENASTPEPAIMNASSETSDTQVPATGSPAMLPVNNSSNSEMPSRASITSSDTTVIVQETMRPNISASLSTPETSSSSSVIPTTASSSSQSANKPTSASTSLSSATTRSSSTTQQTASSSHSSPAPPPGTQESIFKSIHKRLQSLESNTTLSLQYIESQSSLLRSAFNTASQRQATKLSSVLDALNATVLGEMQRMKQDYEQLWQSTVLELAQQREEGRQERDVLGERVKMLAEELVGQKRVLAAQATALLICAGILIFTRLGAGGSGTGIIRIGTGFENGSLKGGSSIDGISTPRIRTFSPTSSPRWLWRRSSPPGHADTYASQRPSTAKSEGDIELDDSDGAAIDIGVGGGVYFGAKQKGFSQSIASASDVALTARTGMSSRTPSASVSPELSESEAETRGLKEDTSATEGRERVLPEAERLPSTTSRNGAHLSSVSQGDLTQDLEVATAVKGEDDLSADDIQSQDQLEQNENTYDVDTRLAESDDQGDDLVTPVPSRPLPFVLGDPLANVQSAPSVPVTVVIDEDGHENGIL